MTCMLLMKKVVVKRSSFFFIWHYIREKIVIQTRKTMRMIYVMFVHKKKN